MRTRYIYNTPTGELLRVIQTKGTQVDVWQYGNSGCTLMCDCTEIIVVEGEEAEREMFNHFGDDSSWPEGWYSKLLKSGVTRASILYDFGPNYTGPKW